MHRPDCTGPASFEESHGRVGSQQNSLKRQMNHPHRKLPACFAAAAALLCYQQAVKASWMDMSDIAGERELEKAEILNADRFWFPIRDVKGRYQKNDLNEARTLVREGDRYLSDRKFAKAQACYLAGLSISLKQCNPCDPEVGATAKKLADSYRLAGDKATASRILKQLAVAARDPRNKQKPADRVAIAAQKSEKETPKPEKEITKTEKEATAPEISKRADESPPEEKQPAPKAVAPTKPPVHERLSVVGNVMKPPREHGVQTGKLAEFPAAAAPPRASEISRHSISTPASRYAETESTSSPAEGSAGSTQGTSNPSAPSEHTTGSTAGTSIPTASSEHTSGSTPGTSISTASNEHATGSTPITSIPAASNEHAIGSTPTTSIPIALNAHTPDPENRRGDAMHRPGSSIPTGSSEPITSTSSTTTKFPEIATASVPTVAPKTSEASVKSINQGQTAWPPPGSEQANPAQRQQLAQIAVNQASLSLSKDDPKEASTLLKLALTMDPQNAEAHFDLGQSLLMLGETDEALNQMKQAQALQPQRQDYKLRLAQSYQDWGKTREAIDTYLDYAANSPDRQSSQLATKAVKRLIDDQYLQAAVKPTAAPTNEDYIAYANALGMLRWPAERMPLKVFVQTDGTNTDRTRMLKEALDEWSEQTGSAVRFEFVKDKSAADIDFSFQKTDNFNPEQSEPGKTDLTYSHRGIKHATTTIEIGPADSAAPKSLDFLKGACLHAIGHALGIQGHSPDPRDVMFNVVRIQSPQDMLTSRDESTIKHLYGADFPSNCDPEAAVVPQAKVAMLTNYGSGLADVGNFEMARTYFERALALDPEYRPAKQDLSLSLNNIGLEFTRRGKNEDAEQCFQKALTLEPETSARRTIVIRNYAALLRKLNRLQEADDLESRGSISPSTTAH
jgi:tetratricopeptide (TPR) repeat protein